MSVPDADGLPLGWAWATLEECVDILDRHRIPVNQREREARTAGKSPDELYPYYGATQQVGWIDDYIFDEELVLLGEDGVPFLDPPKQKAYIIDGKTWVNNHAHVLRAIAELTDNGFLKHYLDQFDYQGYVTGTTRLKLNQTRMKQIPVSLPPRSEQRRSVERIEALFEQSRTARQALGAIPPLVQQFRQSVLTAAFRGDLTERDPNDEPASMLLERIEAELLYDPDLPELPEGWCWTTVGQLLERIDAGRSPQNLGRPAEAGEYGVLKVSAVTWGQFLPQENKAMLPDDLPKGEYVVRAGDLLISRANTVALVGAVVLVHDDYPNLMLSDKTLRLVPISDELSKYYLLYGLRSKSVRDHFEQLATGTSDSMRNISQAKIRSAPIALAPPQEQARIVEKIRALSEFAEILESTVETARRRVDMLDQAILARAFSGRLVPQDPNDEPASQLLARIRNGRNETHQA